LVKEYSRHIHFEAILNFRDLGGYRTKDGNAVAWRKIFRCGEIHLMTENDIARLSEELGITSVIDLRGQRRVEQTGLGPLPETGVKLFNVPLTVITNPKDNKVEEQYLDSTFSDMGEVYLYRIKDKDYFQRTIEALEIIANPKNLPLVFHCSAGKDRSGVLAAILLSVLGVADEDIIQDYTLSASQMKAFLERWDNDPVIAEIHNSLPGYHLLATPESMELFLTAMRREHGSIEDYLYAQGAEPALVENLKKALLVQF